jgi:hypothetical protein
MRTPANITGHRFGSLVRVNPSAATCSSIQDFLCHHPAPNLEPKPTEATP